MLEWSSMRKLLAAIFCLVIPVLGCTDPISENSNPLPVRVGGVQMLTMTTPRALHAAVILHDGRVLICGGTSNANVGGVLNSAEIYDPVAGTFTPTGAMTTARQGHTATVLSHGEVLIAGGAGNVGYRSQLASAEIYDPVSGTFRAVGSMTTPREGHTATLLRDGRVLIAGGSPNGIRTTASAEIFDPRTATFTGISPMGVPREAHSATLLRSGKVLIAGGGRGGMPNGYIVYATAEIFDPASSTFSTLNARMNSDRVGLAAALLDDGQVLLAGGKSSRIQGPFGGNLLSFAPLNTAEVFDPETNSFRAVGTMQKPHYLGVATKLKDGTVLISGGWTAVGGQIGGEFFADLFDPQRNIFSGGARLHVARLNQTSTRLPDGDVMVAGGLDRDANVTATVEFYAPRRGQFVLAPSTTPPIMGE
jgi:Kelch motif